jgi:hypothetical protein
MRKLLGVLAVGFIAMGVVGQAHAATLGFSGTIAIKLATLDPVLIDGTGTAIVNGSGVSGHLTALQLSESQFAITDFVLPVTDTGVFPIVAIQITAQNAVGNFVGSGGAGFGGQMPLNGTAKVCLYGTCGTSGNISNLNVPLSVIGQGGTAFVKGSVSLTVVGAPWTTGTAAVGTLTQMGSVEPASNTGAVGGNVKLVTPIFISTNIGSQSIVPGFGIMSLTLQTPEPGTLAAFSAAFVALVAVGISRRR